MSRRAGIRREGQAECRLAAKEETSLMNAGSAAVAQDLNGETGAWRGRVEEGEVVEEPEAEEPEAEGPEAEGPVAEEAVAEAEEPEAEEPEAEEPEAEEPEEEEEPTDALLAARTAQRNAIRGARALGSRYARSQPRRSSPTGRFAESPPSPIRRIPLQAGTP
jgi:hypothetical protein